MTTTLLVAEVELAKQLGDYWAGTTTTDGSTTPFITMIDSTLMAKENDWVTDNTWVMLTEEPASGTTSLYDERQVSSLSNTAGTLTVNAFTERIVSGINYELRRLFSPSENRRALIYGASKGFPYIHKQVRDESLTVGNWLRDGDLEYNWTDATTNTYWTVSAATATKNTTAPYFTRGAASCALSGSTGWFYQSNTENTDLMELAGKSVTFKAKVWAGVADTVRLGILYDGTNWENSSYHAGNSEWATLSVTKTIDASPSAVSFRVYHVTGTTAYVDDLRAYGPSRDKLYIGDLGLAQDFPHQVFQQSDSSISNEPWQRLRNYEIGSDSYIYLSEGSQDYRLRVIGIGYLDFLLAGVSSTSWTAAIAIDAPQTEILVAEAALHLATQMVMPNFSQGVTDKWMQILGYWKAELAERRRTFGMKAPSATTNWGVGTRIRYRSKYGRVNY